MTPDPLSRTRACFLAGALGDALGAGIEFLSLGEIRARHSSGGVTGYVPAYGRRGAITDDTQMLLFTAEGLIRASVEKRTRGVDDPVTAVRRAYQRWLHTQDVPWEECPHRRPSSRPDGWLITNRDLFEERAPGNTCLSALEDRRLGSRAQRLNGSKGCGGVMRIAPVGLLPLEDPHAVFELGADLAAITHSHPTGYLASGALVVVVWGLARGDDLENAIARAQRELATHDQHRETSTAVEEALQLAAESTPTPEALETLGEGWIAEEALALSLYCSLAYAGEPDPERRLRRSLLLAVNHSGDSDSTGAITGNLLGTLFGVEALPADLLEELECRELIDAVARDFAEEIEREGTVPESFLARYPAT